MNTLQKSFIDSVVSELSLFPCISSRVARWIACQFALESDYGNSHVARSQQNYCGMKTPCLRASTNYSDVYEFASYSSLSDCVIDYVLLLSWNHFTRHDLGNLEMFKAKLVKCNYCPDVNYLFRIDGVFNSYFDACNGAILS